MNGAGWHKIEADGGCMITQAEQYPNHVRHRSDVVRSRIFVEIEARLNTLRWTFRVCSGYWWASMNMSNSVKWTRVGCLRVNCWTIKPEMVKVGTHNVDHTVKVVMKSTKGWPVRKRWRLSDKSTVVNYCRCQNKTSMITPPFPRPAHITCIP